jgi:hypothetical protein
MLYEYAVLLVMIFVECIPVLSLSEFTNYTILYLSDQWVPVTSAGSDLASSKIYCNEKPYRQNGLDLRGLS